MRWQEFGVLEGLKEVSSGAVIQSRALSRWPSSQLYCWESCVPWASYRWSSMWNADSGTSWKGLLCGLNKKKCNNRFAVSFLLLLHMLLNSNQRKPNWAPNGNVFKVLNNNKSLGLCYQQNWGCVCMLLSLAETGTALIFSHCACWERNSSKRVLSFFQPNYTTIYSEYFSLF